MPKIGRNQLISALLGAVTFVLFLRATQFQFVDYDDPEYVLNNPIVKSGITAGGIKWAFLSAYASNWHPLTWISHMLDCALYGLKPAGHHLTNVLLHVANTVLLFWVLLEITDGRKTSNFPRMLSGQTSGKLQTPSSNVGDDVRRLTISEKSQLESLPPCGIVSYNIWACAFVAALFGLHPLHVESVAWVSERKDVLSAFFFLLTIWAYVRYVKAKFEIRNSKLETNSKSEIPKGSQSSNANLPSAMYYVLALLLFACGLMSKPMLVTTPFVLLLLDFWPLGRIQGPKSNSDKSRAGVQSPKSSFSFSAVGQIVHEKLPFFGLSALACVATIWAQRPDAMSTLQGVPFSSRVGNALVTYVLYLWKMVWPRDLAVLYPYREWPVWQVAGAGLLLLAVSFWVVRQAACRPYLAVGWFWYLGTMVPVIGLVQVGIQSMADRYSYLPSIGIFMMVCWGAADLLKALESRNTSAGVGVLVPSPPSEDHVPRSGFNPGASIWWEFGTHWVGERRPVIRLLSAAIGTACLTVLALLAYKQLGFWENSIELFRHTTQVTRNNLRAEYNLGVALARAGQKDEAIAQYRKALAISPTALDVQAKTQTLAHQNLGVIFAEGEDWTNAEAEFRTAVEADPNSTQASASLAGCLIRLGRFAEAISQCETALATNPLDPQAWRWLGVALGDIGKSEEASRALREAVRLNPNGPVELNELGWFLATDPHDSVRNGGEAVGLALRACELTAWQEPRCIGTLDAAYAEAGRFDDAINTARRTRELALVKGQTSVASAAGERLRLYEVGKPYRQSASKGGF